MIIGFTGLIGSGKTTAARMIVSLTSLPSKKESSMSDRITRAKKESDGIIPIANPNWEEANFADPLKEIISILTGIDPLELKKYSVKAKKIGTKWGSLTYRELHTKLGHDICRSIHPDTWINAKDIKMEPGMNYAIGGVKYNNEAEYIKSKGGIIIHLTKGTVDHRRNNGLSHDSEGGIDPKYIDYTIDNDNYSCLGYLASEIIRILEKEGIKL